MVFENELLDCLTNSLVETISHLHLRLLSLHLVIDRNLNINRNRTETRALNIEPEPKIIVKWMPILFRVTVGLQPSTCLD